MVNDMQKCLLLAVVCAMSVQADDRAEATLVFSQPDLEYVNDYSPNPVGLVLGFGLFAIFYLYALVRLFIDEKDRHADYEQKIADDLKQMEKLGISQAEIAEFDKELEIKLAGKAKVEDSSD